jgi:hypothetical protein
VRAADETAPDGVAERRLQRHFGGQIGLRRPSFLAAVEDE